MSTNNNIKQKLIKRLSNGNDNWLQNLADTYSDDKEHATRILSYFEKSWFFVSSPIAAGIPLKNKKFAGLPISCYLISVSNDKNKWQDTVKECEHIAEYSGGIGIDFSEYMHDDLIEKIRELGTHINEIKSIARYKASMAVYLNIKHYKIKEFIALREIRSNVDPKMFIHHGVTITDDFMNCAQNDKPWNLMKKDDVFEVVSARTLLTSIVTTRCHTGEPYIFFVDNANKVQPECYKRLNLPIKTSNLCTEITLPTNENDLTAICCLCSLNIAKYNEWNNKEIFISDIMKFMDNVLTYFIIIGPLMKLNDLIPYENEYIGKRLKHFENALIEHINNDPIANMKLISDDIVIDRRELLIAILEGKTDKKTINSFLYYTNMHPLRKAFSAALLGRDIGIGGCGYSTYLQQNDMCIEHESTHIAMNDIQASIRSKIDTENYNLCNSLGACCAGKQTNLPIRFVNTTAIAPTTMISQFCESSPCVQPELIAFRHKSGFSSDDCYNPTIQNIFQKNNMDTMDNWMKLLNGDFSPLSKYVKDTNVFKGAYDIDHGQFIKLCCTIGQHISQAISLNLFYRLETPVKTMIQHIFLGWKNGIKSYYYHRSESAMKADQTLDVCMGCQ